jgi:hypothetical protein
MKIQNDHFEFGPQSRNEVKLRGEPLDLILWQGEQWAVTEYGLEKRDGTYHVQAKDMWGFAMPLDKGATVTKQCVFVHWFQHLSHKKWCDEDDVDYALQAFVLLFDKNGQRTKTKPPSLMDAAEVEDYAANCANRSYEAAKTNAINGMS